MFKPKTRKKMAGKLRLFIIDGYRSYIQIDFIAHCMKNGIDLFIMPLYCSHFLQSFDIDVFSAFKRAYGDKTDIIFRLNTKRIPKIK